MTQISLHMHNAALTPEMVEDVMDHTRDVIIHAEDELMVMEICEDTHDKIDLLLLDHPSADYVLIAA